MEGRINTELRLESRGASSVPSADLDRTENAFSTRARSNRSTFRDWAANAMWTIPATRMKSRREHRVPLSAPAVALLKELSTEAGGAPPRRPQREGARIGKVVALRGRS